MHIYTYIHSFNSDLYTPVGLYSSIRNRFRKPVLLESNDYHSRSDSSSYIGFNPLIEVILEKDQIRLLTPETNRIIPLNKKITVTDQLSEIIGDITFQQPEIPENSFFSQFAFEYSHLEETTVQLTESSLGFPTAHLILYEYLIVLDHFRDNGQILVNSFGSERKPDHEIQLLLQFQPESELPFSCTGSVTSPQSDADFLNNVLHARNHILRGDVFQLVLSRPYRQPFFGDDFQVYRQLRRLNPSPYLFYADMESYRIMGSSPETQIRLRKGEAEIHPIAGTVRKTEDSQEDQRLIQHLVNDEKENAEHTMLVDLARNDLSKYCDHVRVRSYKEVQHFSHVIHLVSKVTGKLRESEALHLFSGTFPAGTLSGTPKPKALELIQQHEGDTRDYYGGAIGFLGANGTMNLAIVIRSILSKNNVLHFRAGAGIVLDSIPENELQEVANKLKAIRTAIETAHSPLLQEA